MLEKMMKKSRVRLITLLGVAAMALTMWGCGTDGYNDPQAAADAELAAIVTTTSAPAIIDAPTLKSWVDQGKLNAAPGSLMSRDRVALVSVTTLKNYTTASKLHIPNAGLFDSGTELYATREEALGPVGSMVPTGAQMDTVIRKLGIDDCTTVVLTMPKKSGTDASAHYQLSRAYFTFRYWGFDRNRIKILNGGDEAWEAAGFTALTKTTPTITPSSYTVARNAAGLKDVLRFSITEIMGLVDALIADPNQLNNWQMIEARGDGTTTYLKNALRTAATDASGVDALMFVTDRVVAGDTTSSRLYPSKEVLLQRMNTLALNNSGVDAFLSPTKKTVAMCGSAISATPSFVLFDAVLGVPEGNIVLYDGSSSQWTGYSAARITAANPTATAGQIEAWAFDSRVVGTGLTGTNTLLTNFALYAPSNPLMNQIEEFDKAYMTPAAGSTTGGAVAGSAGGGC